MPRPRAEIALSIGVLALGLGAAAVAASLSGEGGYAGIGPNFFPALVSGGLVVLGAWLLWEALSGGWRALGEHDGEHAFDVRAFAWVSAGLFAEIALIGSAGFVPAQAVLFACVARGFGSARPARDFAIGLALAAALFVFFASLLGVALPAGVLAPLLGA